MEDHEKCIRKRDLLFTKKLIYAACIVFGLAVLFYVWSVHIDNYIDDQVNMFEKDCNPSSHRATELLMEECMKAKVYAESARFIAYLMVCYYGFTGGMSNAFDWFLTNMTAIGSTVVGGAAMIAVRKYAFPGWL